MPVPNSPPFPTAGSPLRILFVRESSLIDGTLTLIARLARQATKDGHAAHVLFHDRGLTPRIAALLEGAADILFLDDLPALREAGRLPPLDLIHAFVSGDLLLRLYAELRPAYFPDAAIVLGVYHPRAFFADTRIGPTPDSRLFGRFLRQIPPANLVFMNDAVRRAHGDYFGIDFAGSRTVPLPVDWPTTYVPRLMVDRNMIVSVGRMVEFKNYHRGVIEAIASINRRQPDNAIQYHVYGDGPLRGELERHVAASNADFVHLHGEVDYARLRDAMANARAVIAMGTTVVEAAAAGIPALLAIESSPDRTYGWFNDQQGYEVGERIPGKPDLPYEPLIAAVHDADDDIYGAMCRASWERARAFAIEAHVASYYDFLREADRAFDFRVPRWQQLLLKLARQPFKPRILQKAGHRHR